MVFDNLSPASAAIDTLPVEYIRELGLLGSVASFACHYEPRTSYYLYAPRKYFDHCTARLLVLVHGSNRNAYQLREWYRNFAEEHNVFLLCPLFSIGLGDVNDTDNYKGIAYNGLRYDTILLEMINEAVARYPRIDASRFGLYGFSGGAQFVHRFAYLHPGRIQALVCGAPGTTTEWDPMKEYPEGTGAIETFFESDAEVDWNELQSVPTLFLCGSLDTDDSFCKIRNRPGLGPLGRLGSCQRLTKSWKMQGANVRFEQVEGAKHEERKFVAAVSLFMAERIK